MNATSELRLRPAPEFAEWLVERRAELPRMANLLRA